jgi:hypothetical protein
MQSDFIEAFTRKLEAAGFNLDDFQGCSKEEIAAAMAAQGVLFLPTMYVEFLQLVGHGTRSRSVAWDIIWECKDLLHMKQLAASIDTRYSLSQDAFIFLSYEERTFWLFHTNSRDENPSIHLCAYKELEIVQQSLFEILLEFIDSFI